MASIFENAPVKGFEWGNLGDVRLGRGNLGEEMPVVVYRLMQYTLLDVLRKEFGQDRAYAFFRDAGYLAGKEFSKSVLNTQRDQMQKPSLMSRLGRCWE